MKQNAKRKRKADAVLADWCKIFYFMSQAPNYLVVTIGLFPFTLCTGTTWTRFVSIGTAVMKNSMIVAPKPAASPHNLNSPLPCTNDLAVFTASGFATNGADAEAEAIATQAVSSSTGDQHTRTARLNFQSEP